MEDRIERLETKVEQLTAFAVGLLDSIGEAASHPIVGSMLPDELREALAEARATLAA